MKTFTIATNVKVGNDKTVSQFNWTQEAVDSVLKQIENRIEQSRMLVEVDSEKNIRKVDNIGRVGAKITNAYLSEDGQIMLDAHILDTPMGNILNVLMTEGREGQKIGIKMQAAVEEPKTPVAVDVLGSYIDIT